MKVETRMDKSGRTVTTFEDVKFSSDTWKSEQKRGIISQSINVITGLPKFIFHLSSNFVQNIRK